MNISRLLCVCLAAAVFGGCASTGTNPADPWESANRKIFAVNDALDTYALRPVAKGYQNAVPLPARTQVSNFFGNLEDLWIGTNNLLQGKGRAGLSDFGRFALNSTVGMLGFFDVASEIGLEKHEEDFGQTLAVWGVSDGPYVMLPLFGPSTLRDAAGRVPDTFADAVRYVPQIPVRNSLTGTRAINARSQLLGADDALGQASLDKYSFLRDFFLKRRRSQIYDGHPPRDDDFYQE